MRKHKQGSGVGYGRRTMVVERLEHGSLLARNTFVDASASRNWFINGDNKDNAVLISEVDDGDDNPATHAYLITGLDFADGSPEIPEEFGDGPTIIKGDGVEVDPGIGTSARIVTGVTANIIIDLKKG